MAFEVTLHELSVGDFDDVERAGFSEAVSRALGVPRRQVLIGGVWAGSAVVSVKVVGLGAVEAVQVAAKVSDDSSDGLAAGLEDGFGACAVSSPAISLAAGEPRFDEEPLSPPALVSSQGSEQVSGLGESAVLGASRDGELEEGSWAGEAASEQGLGEGGALTPEGPAGGKTAGPLSRAGGLLRRRAAWPAA